MNDVKSYQSEKDRVYGTGKSKYLEDDRVATGKLLRVTHISGTFEGVTTTEYVELGYYNGHAYIPLKRDKPAQTSKEVHWNGNVWLREQQYVYAYLANVANGEKMKLRAEGRWE